MHRRRFLLYSAISLSPWLGGCGEPEPLRVSYHPWIGYETLSLAGQFGWLPGNVDLERRHSASASLDALREEQADAAALTLDEVARARTQGLDLVVVLVFDVSAGADVVLADPTIRRIADLRGRRIGVETSAVGSLMLDRALEAGGLDRSDVTVIDLPADRHLVAWENRRVDALVNYEPLASRLQQAGMARLADSRDFPDTIFDVLAVRRERLGGARRSLHGLVDAHFRALEHLRISRQDAIYRISEIGGVGPETVRRSLAGVLLPDRVSNLRYLGTESRLVEVGGEFLHRYGGGKQSADWISDEFVRSGERNGA